ncbi:MAG TPA: SIS domain-containing protein, partial [Methanomassiliicoccaceae archaeon]|nr:SIS domain-containing protein [Methanomassiliicoccaceae archaeon]
IKSEAQEVTDFLFGKLPVIYAVDGYNGVATRFRQQINENSKMLCLSGEVPEMDHNQIVGWIDGARDGRNRPVMLLPRSGGYMALDLMRATIELFDDHDIDTVVADLEGASPLESALHGIMLGDFVSYYLAILRGVDPTPVPSIKELKGRLV